ncbi:hypothetical protein NCS56_01166200 [Fusarium sp. Ph1]|nr:hypothetical protein NCS56_01166200 [Fusarium sp. Ph1]
MWNARLGLSSLALFLSTTTLALRVSPGSECAALCSDATNTTIAEINTSSTNSSDIACEDRDFSSSGTGIRFKNCVNCLQKSEATWKEESDVHWFLYNVRYAFDVCLYGYPEAVESGTINSPCNIDGACGALKDALEVSLLKPTDDNRFDFCDADSKAIKGSSYKECISCLRSTSSQKYLSNFLVALRAGCEQRPEQGDAIGLSGTIFTASAVNITDPNTNETLPGDGGAPVGAMTTGTIVGIAVGCGLGLAGFLCIIFIYCRRSRREAAAIKIETPTPDHQMHHHRGAYGIQKASYFSHGAPKHPGGHERGISNAQYYDMLEQQPWNKQANVNYHYAPHSKSNGPNGALPTHPAYMPRVTSKSPEPQMPPNTHRSTNSRSNAPDSYALRAYLNAAEESVEHERISEAASSGHNSRAESRNPSPTRFEKIPEPVVIHAPEPTNAKQSSFTFPSLSKLIIPKKHSPPPPEVRLQEPTPGTASNERKRELRISKPLAVLDPRFTDRPLAGGPIMANQPPTGFNEQRQAVGNDPMPSSNSHIYG